MERVKRTVRCVGLLAGAYGVYLAYQKILEFRDISNQVVVLTGAGQGIGRLMAIRLAKEGCQLALFDINDSLETIAQVKKARPGATCRSYIVDVTNRTLVYSTAQAVMKDFGKVDILVNNAGIVSGRPFLENTDQLCERTVQVNTIAHFWTIKAFLPHMIARNHGHIVTVASAAGIAGAPSLADYCSSKFAAVGFHESVRLEIKKLAKWGIGTSLILPYAINTGMFTGWETKFPLILPILDPQDVADRTIRAIKRGGHNVVMMPPALALGPVLKSLLPVRASDCISEWLGVADAMNGFKQTRQKHPA